ncbi:hypothetical protein OS493_015299 [Desmophyllum pertusum]|uniref:Uncharacterized protein n=1 Tax=Desmophyllum pertusum TaxID=174260 RepID=A0A9W9ZGD4_9CNID|nr:hypothetical protein OS493_015299 [Desmophyllum pertusum]
MMEKSPTSPPVKEPFGQTAETSPVIPSKDSSLTQQPPQLNQSDPKPQVNQSKTTLVINPNKRSL